MKNNMQKKSVMNPILIICFLSLFIMLIIFVLTGKSEGFDQFVYNHIHSLLNPILTEICIVVSWFGDIYFIVPSIVLLLLIPKTRYNFGLPVAITAIVSSVSNLILTAFCQEFPRLYRRWDELARF